MSTSVATQTLGLANDLFTDLLAGKTNHTIRIGEKDIEPGFMMYQNSQDPSMTAYVWVKDVMHVKLKGATVKLGDPLETLIADLQPHYPMLNIDGETQVTLIRHLTVDETTKIFPKAS